MQNARRLEGHYGQNDCDEAIECCLSGSKLYGDDFTEEVLEDWFHDEKEGYYNLVGSAQKTSHSYGYYALNMAHGFDHLPKKVFESVLGIGSAFGEELHPVVGRMRHITVLEPSDGFVTHNLEGVPCNYIKPYVSGDLPFQDNSFDLITCFGVLHHIPNVSKVVREIYRCLMPGGYVLIREPIISMGDWRKPRRGLTKRERGIPYSILSDMIRSTGFEVVRERQCMFSLTSRLRYVLGGKAVYNSPVAVSLDELLCALPLWPTIYHPRYFWHKVRPTSAFYVLRKHLCSR